jgi:transposase InsO family protein
MCRIFGVTRQGYYKHLESLGRPHRHAALLAAIRAIINEDEFNDTYGRERIHDALLLRGWTVSLSTVYRVCRDNDLQAKRNKPKGLTKAEKDAYKNDDLLKGDFEADAPNERLISDITQLPTVDGTLYISPVFDCFDAMCVGLSMDDNMKTPLVIHSLRSAIRRFDIQDADFHTDRGSQYTSNNFREFIATTSITQSMSYAGSGCHGNARCESFFGRFKEEAIYGRYRTELMKMEDVKSLVFRYFMGYWNNRRINHAIGGMPPLEKRRRYYDSLHNDCHKLAS